MKTLNLAHTEALMRKKAANEEFDSYAVYVKYGDREHTFFSENVNEQTYFDIASCGKILITTPLTLQAVAEGKLTLDSTIDCFLPGVPIDKKAITIQHLLTHTSGIVRHQYVNSEREAVIAEILARPLAYEIGQDYRYSCSGMVLMGYILENIYQKPLEQLFEERLKKPLGYERSKFNIAVDEENAAICYHSKDVAGFSSPWDDNNNRVLRTTVGHGGQFFTPADIKKFTKAVLEKDERLYPAALFAEAEAAHSPACAKETRGLGWLYVDEKYAQTGKLFPKGSFGHCGHCGQSIFFNREKELCVVILTNATRFVNKRANFQGYDYSIVCEMRRCIHNEIYKDLNEQKAL